jgi:EpsI family protein
MPNKRSAFRTPIIVVSVLLLVQISAFYGMSTSEFVPNPPPLKTFPSTVGPWVKVSETNPESDITDLLRADDWVNREYVSPLGKVNFWVAFYKTQRTGVSPHSPKVCLPGNGWQFESSGTLTVSVPGEPAPIKMNRDLVSSRQNRMLAFYWYQTPHRVVANEYLARIYLILDGLRYRRSDTAMIRVLSPIINDQEDVAERNAVEFIKSVYPPLKQQLWHE